MESARRMRDKVYISGENVGCQVYISREKAGEHLYISLQGYIPKVEEKRYGE